MRYAFDDFEVDLRLFELRHKGQRVRVEPKVFDLLVFLLQHPERVVSKRELLDTVWRDEHVVEAVLPTAVRRLRTALGQRGETDGPIATERGRGYRFTAEVRRLDAPAPAAPEPAPELFPRERGTDVVELDEEEPLIGREAVVTELSAVLERVAGERRRPRMRLVCGPPGVGRTRMLAEAVRLARARRVPAYSTRGRSGAPELWPWSTLVRQVFETLPDGAREAMPRALRRELSLLAPALRSGDTIPPGPVQGREPLVVADTVRNLFALASPSLPALLVIDDLDRLDAASLDVTRALAEEPARRPLVLCSVCEPLARDSAPARMLQELERGERLVRVPLVALDVEQTAAYLRGGSAAGPPEAVARHVHGLTAGLPAVLRACTRAWPKEALRTLPAAQLLRLPTTAWEPARRLLSALPDAQAELLRVASVLGERFDLALLCAVSGQDAERVLGALEHAQELSLVVADEAQPPRYRFTLGYVRDALHDDLRPVERRPLHRAAAEALELRAQTAGDAELTRLLADHTWNALPAVPVAAVVRHNVRAAEQLGEHAQWSEAALHYGRALEALGYETRRDPRASAELLLALGRAQRAAGDADAARACFEQAEQLAAGLPDADALRQALRAEQGAG